MAGAGGRAEEAFAEARAFFIRPIDEAHGHGRLAVVLRVEAAQNLDAGQRVEGAIEPAAVRHRIDMAADQERLFGFAAQCRPKIPGFIGMNFGRQFIEFPAEPGAGFRPSRREGDALRAVFVAGQVPQFLQFRDGSFRIESRSHSGRDYRAEREFSIAEAAIAVGAEIGSISPRMTRMARMKKPKRISLSCFPNSYSLSARSA